MSKLCVPKLKLCTHRDCEELGVAKDKKCIYHTSFRNISRCSDAPVPTPHNQGIQGEAMGVEIECYPKHSICYAFPNVTNWTTDGSLDCYGREIRLCNTPQKIKKIAADVVYRIKHSGGMVNLECGLHVHVSKKRQTIRNHVFNTIVARTNGKIKTLFHDRRYAYVNDWVINRCNTYEIRIHPATLNPHVIIAWLDYCEKWQKIFNGDQKLLEKLEKSNYDLLSIVHKNSYAYKYLNYRKNNNGRIDDDTFSLTP